MASASRPSCSRASRSHIRDLFDGAPDGKFSLNVLWNRAIEKGRLFGVRLDGLWMHVGDPGALKEAEETLANTSVVTVRPGARP